MSRVSFRRLRALVAGGACATLVGVLLGLGGALASTWAEPPAAGAPPAASTWSAVSPIFERACVHCHGGDRPVANLSLDQYVGAKRGGASGAAVVPGDPKASRLVQHLRGALQPAMPLDGDALPEAEIARIETWIASGAADAPPAPASAPGPAAPAAPAVPGPAPAPQPPAAVPAPVDGQPAEPLRYARIAPILRANCVRCHQTKGLMGPPPERLRLDTLEHLLRGGDRLVVVPGKPAASPLVRALRGQGTKRMPLGGPPWLREADVLLLERWIAQGARDDQGRPAALPVGGRLRLVGTLDAAGSVDGIVLRRGAGARIDERARVGDTVEARVVVAADGTLDLERLKAR